MQFFFSSTSRHFCPGLDREEMATMDEEQLKKLLLQLQRIIYGLYFLPQTVICDLKLGAEGMGAVISLGSDLRLAHRDVCLQFDFLKRGLVPMGGATSILCDIVGQGFARNWIMSSRTIAREELVRSGFISDTYHNDDQSKAFALLDTINEQAAVARIQTKRSLLEFMQQSLEHSLSREPLFAFAGLKNEDWKKGLNAELGQEKAQYASPLAMVQELQKEKVN